MALLSGVLTAPARADVTWHPLDNRWYLPDLGGISSDAGVLVSAETMFRCDVVLAAVRFLADSYAMCVPHVGRQAGEARQPAPTHYAQRVLRKPNAWQTGYRWRHINMTWAATWGNSYNRIIGGTRAFVEELRPMHPSRCRAIDQRGDGTLVYEWHPPQGPKETLNSSEVLHYRGLSLDGISGAVTYQLIRNAVGIALAAEKHLATFLKKGSRLAGLLVPEAPTKPEDRKTLRESWNESFGGAENTGTVATLPYGVKFLPVASGHKDAQFLELNDLYVQKILRGLGVPGVVVGYQGDKASTYASAKEFFESGGIKHCVMPWVMNFEEEEGDALLLEEDDHYIKHSLDVLLRANTQARYEALFKAVGRPWMSPNEARAKEDMNPDPDPESNKIATASMGGVDGEMDKGAGGKGGGGRKRQTGTGEEDEASGPSPRERQFALDAAARIVRREVATIKGTNGTRGKAVQYAKDPAGWRAWVVEFYEKHTALVAETMHISEEVARTYCTGQRDALLAGGAAVLELWEESVPEQLAELALGAGPSSAVPSVQVNIRNVLPRPRVGPLHAEITTPPAQVTVLPAPAAPPPKAKAWSVVRDAAKAITGFKAEE